MGCVFIGQTSDAIKILNNSTLPYYLFVEPKKTKLKGENHDKKEKNFRCFIHRYRGDDG